MAMRRTPNYTRVRKAVALMHEIKATLDARAGRQFCIFCVGVMETDLDTFPYRHEDTCIHTSIKKWLDSEFEEV